MIVTPKTAAVLWLLDNLTAVPEANQTDLEEVIDRYLWEYTQKHTRLTKKQLDAIQDAYLDQVAKIKKRYERYLKGRGIKL